ncbi:hypothetical protein HUN01_21850 [Nostoc edaphicum CCNP1411]|uniref:Uncharacterized protein n=1 Tax=Nostoc edaphicum CCNP1411 TaxID=1472755 RepID=A0A7D7QH88_9NOSO|nr:hypothetical protein [Nostoc edaphicum]QMS90102.1 hypothetical protein HUN01_21850 [Nostoc edaphicum CCNP1411]
MNESWMLVDESLILVNESLNSVNEPRSFVREPLSFVDEPRSFLAMLFGKAKDAINRRLYKGMIIVETAIYRVFVIMRFISLIDFDSNSGERIRIYAKRSQIITIQPLAGNP